MSQRERVNRSHDYECARKEAFEAMREALREWCATIERCNDTFKLATDEQAPEVMKHCRAALALADEVSR